MRICYSIKDYVARATLFSASDDVFHIEYPGWDTQSASCGLEEILSDLGYDARLLEHVQDVDSMSLSKLHSEFPRRNGEDV